MRDLGDVAVSAQFHRDQFFKDDWFSTVLDEIQEARGINALSFLTVRISDFLRRRKIDPEADVQTLAEMNREDARLLGDSYHIGRKGFLTNYDIVLPRETTPLDASAFVGNLLSWLDPVDNSRAATFLENICDVCSKDSQNQQIVSAAVMEVLPALMHRYNMQLSEIQISGKPSKVTGEEEARLKEWYGTALNRFMQYVNQAIKYHRMPTLADFGQYAGIQFGNGQDDAKGNRDLTDEPMTITLEYLTELSRRHGRNHAAAIAELKQNVGDLVVVNNHRQIGGDGIKLFIGSGTATNPKPNQVTYTKTKHGAVYGLLIAICEHIAADVSVPPPLRTTTATTRTSIVSYQTRG